MTHRIIESLNKCQPKADVLDESSGQVHQKACGQALNHKAINRLSIWRFMLAI
ncbi:MAG: hypothetical protein Q8K98_01600 [Bacteroidota bacterium]|nr:hypothetical protein [Bacteroidota bacterium]